MTDGQDEIRPFRGLIHEAAEADHKKRIPVKSRLDPRGTGHRVQGVDLVEDEQLDGILCQTFKELENL